MKPYSVNTYSNERLRPKLETVGIDVSDGKKFLIENRYYLIKDGLGDDWHVSADEAIKKFGINSLEYLQRLHETRKNVYKTLTSFDRLPIGTIDVRLSEKGTSWCPPPDSIYTFKPKPADIDLTHEVSHEAQFKINKKFRHWHNLDFKLMNTGRPFTSSVVHNLDDLETEGFATFFSGSYAEEFSDKTAKDFLKCLYKGHCTRFHASPHSFGLHIFRTIDKNNHKALNVGLTKDPIGMIKSYEKSCELLGLQSYISMKIVEELVPNYRDLFYGKIENVPFDERDVREENIARRMLAELEKRFQKKTC